MPTFGQVQRRPWVALLLAVCAAGATAAACAPVPAAGPAEMPVAPGPLLHTLEWREGQGGFAGTSGQVWRVEPDGAYTVARFLNSTEDPPHAKGRLLPAQMAALAAALRDAEVAGLPERLGTPGTVNPRTAELRYAAKRTAMHLPPSDDAVAVAAAGGATAQARFARLILALKAALPVAAR